MTAPPLPAYTVYNRRTVPASTGPQGSSELASWLATELRIIQRAIPVRFTRTVTANYTLLTTDDVVLVDTTSGAVRITWPDPTRAQHYTGTVKKIDASSNAVTFASTIASTSTAATFDGVTSPTLVSQYDSRAYRSNGIEYYQTVEGVTAIFSGSVPAANVTHGTFGSATGDTGIYKFPSGAITGTQYVPATLTGIQATTADTVIYGDVGSALRATFRVMNIAGSSNIDLVRAQGTVGAPTALTNGITIGNLSVKGYDGVSAAIQTAGSMAWLTTQAWNGTSHGTKLIFQTTPNGSTAVTTALTLDQDQSATFAGAVSMGTLTATTGTFSGLVTAVTANGVTTILRLAQTGAAAWNITNNATDGKFAINDSGSTWLIITPTTGVTQLLGATDIGGNFSVNTSKFTVAASTGNTVVAGTLGVAGLATFTGTTNTAAYISSLANVGGFVQRPSVSSTIAEFFIDNTITTGGKKWHLGNTNASTNVGDYSLYQETNNFVGWSVNSSTGAFTVPASIISSGPLVLNGGTSTIQQEVTQTAVLGAVSGGLLYSQTDVGGSYKQIIIYCVALVGAATFTYPVAFSHTPEVISQSLGGIVTTISATGITITGTTSTGFITLNGF